jgi:hypothetical protein
MSLSSVIDVILEIVKNMVPQQHIDIYGVQTLPSWTFTFWLNEGVANESKHKQISANRMKPGPSFQF